MGKKQILGGLLRRIPKSAFEQNMVRLKNVMETRWGKCVVDFLVQEDKFGVPAWKWKDPRELRLPGDAEIKFREMLQPRTIKLIGEEDQIVWCGAKSGNYAVKFGYKFLDQEQMGDQWPQHLLWRKDCLQKAGAFAWLAIRERILTGDQLSKLGFAGPFKCVMCKKEIETPTHLLLHCLVAQNCWTRLLQKIEWVTPLMGSLLSWFQAWGCWGDKSVYSSIWKISPSALI